MAGELQATCATGSTLYALLRDSAGAVYNGSTFDATPTVGEWANYDIAMSEDDTTGLFRGTMPSVAAGSYSFEVRLQAGGSPAETDRVVGQGWLDWDGAAVVDADSILAGIEDIQSRIPAALASGRIKADILAINGSTSAAVRLALSAANMIPGTVDNTGFSPTTTIFESDDITEATDDHYNGRLVLWTSGALAGQTTDVTDYELASGRGRFTCTAMTEAPANDDTFLLV